MKKVLIGMSGGVDSSVSAKIVLDKGYDGIGCTMKLYDNEDSNLSYNNTCCSLNDVEDARSIACKLSIPYYVFNFTEDFYKKVIHNFVNSYNNGLTPNPCIDCNKYMKFGKLFDRADILGCDFIATGHYAKIEYNGHRYLLKKAIDELKDQSYVLYDMTQKQLSRTIFPLGDIKKTEVRAIAKRNGFINAHKPDSQDICFVPNGDYVSVIEFYNGKKSQNGNFLDMFGNILGHHKGIIHYTIGQRKGLGISSETPMYVCKISAKDNTVILGKESDLYSNETFVKNFNWVSIECPKKAIRCFVKIRYRHKEQPATVIPLNNDVVHIIFDRPQRAITSGQSAVLYDQDLVLGGGIID